MAFSGFRPAGHHLSALTYAIVVVLGVATTSPVFGQAKPKGSPVEQALIKMENDCSDASAKLDMIVLGHIVADEYIFTDPDGVMWTKAQARSLVPSSSSSTLQR